MQESSVTLAFTDGSVIEAEANGTCFITDRKPTFPDDMSLVTASDGREYRNAELIECASIDGRYWFSFLEKSDGQLEMESIREVLDYLLMGGM